MARCIVDASICEEASVNIRIQDEAHLVSDGAVASDISARPSRSALVLTEETGPIFPLPRAGRRGKLIRRSTDMEEIPESGRLTNLIAYLASGETDGCAAGVFIKEVSSRNDFRHFQVW
ncbi:uncharacterized protein [Macrobrachium rosenbergii]|uniref:uncharacterized protein n=1 Tax=Macrobrachium rosenbergii TaxID=79674 RepID=UPI0034D6A641